MDIDCPLALKSIKRPKDKTPTNEKKRIKSLKMKTKGLNLLDKGLFME